mmetsp:Transcript_55514/g.130334  ORF Transcript_55514/g.130334 Transcript_55514/m.130334 type:complete len:208 (-) Transcript_55514:22-645(-)
MIQSALTSSLACFRGRTTRRSRRRSKATRRKLMQLPLLPTWPTSSAARRTGSFARPCVRCCPRCLCASARQEAKIVKPLKQEANMLLMSMRMQNCGLGLRHCLFGTTSLFARSREAIAVDLRPRQKACRLSCDAIPAATLNVQMILRPGSKWIRLLPEYNDCIDSVNSKVRGNPHVEPSCRVLRGSWCHAWSVNGGDVRRWHVDILG